MKQTTIALSLCLISALTSWMPTSARAQSFSKDKADMAGVRIGMTEAEVMKAVQAFDASAKLLRRHVASFSYFDGVNSLQTPEFLDLLEFRGQGTGIRVWFSGPPSETRVIAISSGGTPAQPPGGEQMLSALTSKYGPFTARTPARPGGDAVVHWQETGKAHCAVTKDSRGQRAPWSDAVGTLLLPGAPTVLERYARQGLPHLREALGASPDVARCGAVVRYQWSSDPVRSFEGWLVDQGGMVEAHRKSAQWVEQLKSEAVRKRQGQGSVPKL